MARVAVAVTVVAVAHLSAAVLEASVEEAESVASALAAVPQALWQVDYLYLGQFDFLAFLPKIPGKSPW